MVFIKHFYFETIEDSHAVVRSTQTDPMYHSLCFTQRYQVAQCVLYLFIFKVQNLRDHSCCPFIATLTPLQHLPSLSFTSNTGHLFFISI